jgi:hypothetical protein
VASLQDVFARHFASFAATRHLHPRQSQAARCILQCYTEAAGSHLEHCPSGHFSRQRMHACRHRSCPQCAEPARSRWIDAEFARLLPCPHFHVIFTLPHELLPLWEFNRTEFAQALFDSVRSSLLELLADPRHLGATPGLLLSLHTWGRTLSHHPHVHALVSAGGLSPSGAWRSTRPGFLLPLKPLQRLFAGKLLGAVSAQLRSAAWRLPPRQPAPHCQQLIRRLYRRHWNVQINPPYAHGRGVALYLARYARGGPLPRSHALHCDDQHVRFSYTDHRDGQRKWLTLQAAEFIDRLLWHAPPKGAHTLRHAGLYARAHQWHHAQAQIALACASNAGYSAPGTVPITTAPRAALECPKCPTCHLPLLRTFIRPPPRYESPPAQISYSISTQASDPAAHHRTGARHNWSFELTCYSKGLWPRGAQDYVAPRGHSPLL